MLQFITDGHDVDTTINQAIAAIDGGCCWIQIRMKEASNEDVVKAAGCILAYARDHNTTVLLDDRVHLVKTTGVDGVHIGKEDMPPEEARMILGNDAIIGVTVNTLEDVISLNHEIIDYMGMGPFRFTTTKKKLATTLGATGYRKIIGEARIRGIFTPVIAIGGIMIEDIKELMATGIDGIAVSGAIGRSDNPVEATKQFLKTLNIKR